VIRSLGLGLDEKSIEAVKQWKFKPATRNKICDIYDSLTSHRLLPVRAHRSLRRSHLKRQRKGKRNASPNGAFLIGVAHSTNPPMLYFTAMATN
jgi:hypothetical protein